MTEEEKLMIQLAPLTKKQTFRDLGLMLLKKDYNGRNHGVVVFHINRNGVLEIFFPEGQFWRLLTDGLELCLQLTDPALEITPKVLRQRCLMLTFKDGEIYSFEHPSSTKVALESFNARREKAALAAQEKANTPS